MKMKHIVTLSFFLFIMASHSILSLTLLIAQPKTGLPLNVAVNVYISEGNLTAPKLISPENSSGS